MKETDYKTTSNDSKIVDEMAAKRNSESADFIAAEAAINAALANNISAADLIAVIEGTKLADEDDAAAKLIEKLIADSKLQDLINQIIANDFKTTTEGEHGLSTAAAQKLGLFSLGFVNAVANSFMGLPSAAILVALDNLFTHPLALAALTGPDKLLLLVIALIILTIFIKIAYKQNYVETKQKSEYLRQVYDTFAEYVCSEPEPDEQRKIINKALHNKYLAESIIAIRSGDNNQIKKEGLLLAEQQFQEAASIENIQKSSSNQEAALSDEKINAIMMPVFYITTGLTAFFISYFSAIMITTPALSMLYVIPIVCTVLLTYQIIKYCITEYYKPRKYLTTKDEYYLALYRVMLKHRNNNDLDLSSYIEKVTDKPAIRTAVARYLASYNALRIETSKAQLQKIDDTYMMLSHNNYQKGFSQLGQVLGTTNAILNGILCCAFGITGIVTVIAIFVPGFQLSLGIAIIAAICLFLGGAVHSFRFTRPYVASVFSSFGQTLDKIKVSGKHLSYTAWLKILAHKTAANSKAIGISFCTSVAISALGFIAISNLLLTFPVSIGVVVAALVVTTLLNFTACISLFTKTLQDKAQKEKDIAEIQDGLPDGEKAKIQKLKQRINIHYSIGAIATLIAFAVCVSPLLSLTVVPAIFIAFTTFFIVFMGSAIIDFKHIQESNQPGSPDQTLNTILDLRLRICIITLFGLAFGLASGPAVGAVVFSMLPAAIMPASLILAISILSGLAIGASLCYAYTLVYWHEAVKPADLAIKLNINLTDPLGSKGQDPSLPSSHPIGDIDRAKDDPDPAKAATAQSKSGSSSS